jgi:hypothetical protein
MSFISVAEDSDFPIHNLPFGVFSTPSNVSCCASALARGGCGVEWNGGGQFATWAGFLLKGLGGESLWFETHWATFVCVGLREHYMQSSSHTIRESTRIVTEEWERVSSP